MRSLEISTKEVSAFELLNAWEEGVGQQATGQALRLLRLACPGLPIEELARMTIGRRDALLLSLRELAFGSKLLAMMTCPSCAGLLEFSFNAADLRRLAPAPPGPANEDQALETHTMSVAGHDVTFRLPNTLDLEASRDDDRDAFWRRLFRCCVLAAEGDGEQKGSDDLPAEVVAAVLAKMEEVDPQANVVISLCCPACSHEWQAIFDIASFFWSEINAWARRTLREVHALASAYGWRESEILAMSAWRRDLYLRMVGT